MACPKAARNYVFTSYIDLDYNSLNQNQKSRHIRYMVCQREICPTTNREHVQGYVEFDKMMTRNQVKESIGDPAAHLEKRLGSQQQAIDYCTKNNTRVEDSVPFILGEKAIMGERNDLKGALEAIKKKKPISEIIEEQPNLLRYYKQLEMYKRDTDEERDRNEPVEVEVLIGEPGTGKTKHVFDKEKDLFSVPIENGSNIWFDGYRGQEAVLFDDFYGGIKYHLLLKLLDRYPIKVPIKGGFVNWKPKRIYITSNKPVNQWYNKDDIRALERRISKCFIFEARGNTRPSLGELINGPYGTQHRIQTQQQTI